MKKRDTASELLLEFIGGNGLNINRLRKLYKKMSPESFRKLVSKIEILKDAELTGQFIYYLTLFREEEEVQKNIRKAEIPLSILEYFIIAVYTHASFIEKDEYLLLDNLIHLFEQHDIVRLITESTYIYRDPALYGFLSTVLERKYIDELFNTHPDIREYLHGLTSLPDKKQREFYKRNVELYGYVTLFCPVYGLVYASMHESVTGELGIKDHVGSIVSEIFAQFNVQQDKTLRLHERDRNRLSFIVTKVKESGRGTILLDDLASQGVIIDDLEKSLIEEIMYNPVFKPVLTEYIARQTDNYVPGSLNTSSYK